jgi:hypothetical protein
MAVNNFILVVFREVIIRSFSIYINLLCIEPLGLLLNGEELTSGHLCF